VLILPKIHKSVLHDYTQEELNSVYALLTKRETLLYAKHEELVIFLRAGKILGPTGKTMDHLHRHIIPHFTIQFGGSQESSDKRVFLDDIQYTALKEHMKQYL
jgi:diadenosine tetraphosphate (Ap4A) HIT family hydrolase